MIDHRLAPYGIFTLRAALGIMFIAHEGMGDGAFALKPAGLPVLSGPALTPKTA